jgi:putative tricarboxylic transport membrane protein
VRLDRKVPLGAALQDGAKGHNMKEKYLTGKPRPLGRGASILRSFGKGGEMRRADIYVGLGLMAVGLLVLGDAIRLGFGWGMSGPEAGFFPFYMSLGIVICTFFIVLRGIRVLKKEGAGKPLIKQGGLNQILWVLIPAAGMVILTELIGLHMATVLYLAFYMGVVGKENWIKVAVLSILVPLVVYVVFDRVFLIPLPEGLWGKNVLALLP